MPAPPTRSTTRLITSQQLAEAFAVNAQLAQTYASDSVRYEIEPPTLREAAGALNWTLGHILVIRDRVLGLLGDPPMLQSLEREHYTRRASAETTSELRLEHQLQLLERGQVLLAEGLGRLTADDFMREMQVGVKKLTVASRLLSLYFHDTYHLGQLELHSRAVLAADPNAER
jgi:hypothetical protein